MIRRLFLLAACWMGLLSGVIEPFDAGPLRVAGEERCAVLEVFVRDDGSRSQAARDFVERTFRQRQGLIIHIRDVSANDRDLDRFWTLADHFRVEKPGLPAFYVSGQFFHGWNAEMMPKRLEEALTVEVFVRSGCRHCAAARPVLFEQLAPRYRGYQFVERDIGKSSEALQRVQALSQRYGVQASSVPAVHLCGRLMVGFLDSDVSYRQWDDVLKAETVPCPEEKTEPKRRLDRRGHVESKESSRGFLSSKAFGGEPPESEQLAAVAETAQGINSAVDEAPPRRRVLPDDLPTETEPSSPLPSETTANPDVVTLPLVGDIRWRDWGMPAFTLMVGLVDGFNPCAMWVLLFLLSLLVNLHDRWKILGVAGTFVLISAAAYLAFMAAWLNVFQLFNLLRPAQIGLGLIGIAIGAIHIKDFFAFKQGLSLSIPESAKPGLYERMRRIVLAQTLWAAIAGAAVLAVLVNILELLCTAGLPAMYTGILASQDYPRWLNYLYLLLYIGAYLFDDSLMVAIVVVTLSRHKLQERGGRILKLISGIVILAIGAIMLFNPEWLV